MTANPNKIKFMHCIKVRPKNYYSSKIIVACVKQQKTVLDSESIGLQNNTGYNIPIPECNRAVCTIVTLSRNIITAHHINVQKQIAS